MTLLELCETNGHIVHLDIYVRNEKTELQHVYRIGMDARMYMSDREDRTTIIKKPLHVAEDGAANYQYGFITRNVPKALRNMEVTQWQMSHTLSRITDARELWVDVVSDKTEPQLKQIGDIETEEDADQMTWTEVEG